MLSKIKKGTKNLYCVPTAATKLCETYTAPLASCLTIVRAQDAVLTSFLRVGSLDTSGSGCCRRSYVEVVEDENKCNSRGESTGQLHSARVMVVLRKWNTEYCRLEFMNGG